MNLPQKDVLIQDKTKDGIKIIIEKANLKDLEEILNLQYLSYQSEAKLLNNYNIPPLKQTIKDVQNEYEKGTILKVTDGDKKIIGSVRGYLKNDTLYIGKLIVNPAWQGKGIGTKLLKVIESIYQHARFELFTSSNSEKNLRLYERAGYNIFKEEEFSKELTFKYLEKFSAD